jgi:DNA-binding MarR family transcriptional regulator
MAHSLLQYLADQPLMTIVRALLHSSDPRHLRDLANQHSISPAGVSDILRRLKQLGVLKEYKRGNRRCVALDISDHERSILTNLFSAYQVAALERRAKTFSRRALKKFIWIDEARSYARDLPRGTR